MYRTLSCIASSVLCCAALLADPPAAPRTAEGFPDLALIPPPLNTRPGPEYGNDMRKFQGIPTIERASNGRLWAAWYGGGSGQPILLHQTVNLHAALKAMSPSSKRLSFSASRTRRVASSAFVYVSSLGMMKSSITAAPPGSLSA